MTDPFYTIANQKITVSIDREGRLCQLVNRDTGHDYAGGGYLCRIIYQHDDMLEEVARPVVDGDGCQIDTDSLLMPFTHCRGECGDLALSGVMEFRLGGDQLHASISLTNDHEGTVIRECMFPMVAACDLPEDHHLIWSNMGGQRFENPRVEVLRWNSQYFGMDHKFIQMWTRYPGSSAAMNCFVFAGDSQGLYLGSHDPSFQQTMHLLRMYGEDLEAGFVKFPFLLPGQSKRLDGFVLSTYSGSWHAAGDIYRRWADEWFSTKPMPNWLQTMPGWQRVTLKHQYGERYYNCEQIEQIHRDGESVGIDTLMLFGWYREGHDVGYPLYSYDASQGGEEMLRAKIHEMQSRGGHVILYFNGQLIDRDTEWYRNHGHQLTMKDPAGMEYQEVYNFGGEGTLLREFGNRMFVRACPACDQWYEVLKELADRAIDLGCDGVFFDQLGSGGHMCYDPSHGHETPCLSIGAQKAALLERLRNYVRQRDPNMGFGIELISDVTAPHADFVHNLVGGCEALNDWESRGEKPRLRHFLDFFRYTFPEIRLSDREIRDDTDVPRRVNHALLKGLVSDVEIFRCRTTISDAPAYGRYLVDANRLRRDHANLLLNGVYRDVLGFTSSNEEIEARAFEHDQQMAVVLTQSHLENAATEIEVPGADVVASDGLGEYVVTQAGRGKVRVGLGQHGLAVIVFQCEPA